MSNSIIKQHSYQRHYGVAVADVDQDGKDEFIVTGNGAPNRVYSYDKNTDSYVNIIEGVANVEASSEHTI